jgi:CheY-like chemotaxis protein
MDKSRAELLVIEDNPSDVFLIEEGLKQERIDYRLSTVQDGADALAFLHRQGEYRDASKPDLILLDLGLPGKDGREILAEIQLDDELRSIPIAILTGSQADSDVTDTLEEGARWYITKPHDLEGFIQIAKTIKEFLEN